MLIPPERPVVNPGSICRTAGQEGATPAGTIMVCRMPAQAKTPHLRWGARDPRPTRTRQRRSYRGAGLQRQGIARWVSTQPDAGATLPAELAEQINARQLAALRRAAGLAAEGKDPRKTDQEKLDLAGLIQNGELTARGAATLVDLGQLADGHATDDDRVAFAAREAALPKPVARPVTPVRVSNAVNLDVDEPDTPMEGWEQYLTCTVCKGRPGRACRNLRRTCGGKIVYNQGPHPGRPTTQPADDPADEPAAPVIDDAAIRRVADASRRPGSVTLPREGTACASCRRRWTEDGVERSTQVNTLCTGCVQRETAGSLENRIRTAYHALSSSPGAWVMLSRLRARFPDVDRSDLDRALLTMMDSTDVEIETDENQKTLRDVDRAAALTTGGEHLYLMSIGQRTVDNGDWSGLGPCDTCTAAAGHPCWDLRTHGAFTGTPHPGRLPLHPAPVVDEQEQAAQAAYTKVRTRSRECTPEDFEAALRASDMTAEDRRVIEGLARAARNAADPAAGSEAGQPDPRQAAYERLVADGGVPGAGTEDLHGALQHVLDNKLQTPTADAVVREASRRGFTAADPHVAAATQRAAEQAVLDRRTPPALNRAAREAAEHDQEVKDAVRRLVRDGDYATLADLRAELPKSMTREQVDAALHRLHLDPDVVVAPETNQKTLTQARRTAATKIGGQDQHIIAVREPFDRAAADRAIADPSNATDAELEMAQRAPGIPSRDYDRIRGVVRKRAQDAAPATLSRLENEASYGGPAGVERAYNRLSDDDRMAVTDHAGIGGIAGGRAALLAAKLTGRPVTPRPEVADLERRIRGAYDRYRAAEPDMEWYGLAELRAALPDVPREDLDKALVGLLSLGQRHYRIVPIANRKAMSPDDHDAALDIGGEGHNCIMFRD